MHHPFTRKLMLAPMPCSKPLLMSQTMMVPSEQSMSHHLQITPAMTCPPLLIHPCTFPHSSRLPYTHLTCPSQYNPDNFRAHGHCKEAIANAYKDLINGTFFKNAVPPAIASLILNDAHLTCHGMLYG